MSDSNYPTILRRFILDPRVLLCCFLSWTQHHIILSRKRREHAAQELVLPWGITVAVIDTYFGFQFGIYENALLPHAPKTKLGHFLNTSFLIAHDKYTIRVIFFFSDEFLSFGSKLCLHCQITSTELGPLCLSCFCSSEFIFNKIYLKYIYLSLKDGVRINSAVFPQHTENILEIFKAI